MSKSKKREVEKALVERAVFAEVRAKKFEAALRHIGREAKPGAWSTADGLATLVRILVAEALQ